MKKVLLLLHPGFEEIEAVTPIDLLRRAGIEVTVASIGVELQTRGSHGIVLLAEVFLADCIDDAFDMLVIPGGPGIESLRKQPEALFTAKKFYMEGRFLAAICAAPLIFLDAGILTGHVMTSFPETEKEFQGKVKSYLTDRVCVDGRLITSRGAGTSEEFSLALIHVLLGPVGTEQIRQRIVAR